MTDEGIVIYILIPTTPSEQEKLECKDLERTITNIAKDLHVDWAVETLGVAISKTFGPVVNSEQEHETEIAASNFMTAISKLELPAALDVDKKVKDPEPSQLEGELNFCKEVLDGFDENEEEFGIVGARLLCGPKNCRIPMPCGRIGRSLLRKMFESFIKVHSNDE